MSRRGTKVSSAGGNAGRIRVQHVAVPKGGGAIRGMGEQFQAHEFSGAAALSIPLHASACRGFEPKLSLAYQSLSGNGTFGLGWGVAVESFRRRTSRGIPRYAAGDVVLFDGQTLVPHDASATSRHVGDTTYAVKQFWRRIEGAFERIEFWQDAAGENSFWRILHHDASISLYGKTSQSRIADPADPRRVFEWKLEERLDPKGNLCVYRYKQEDYADPGPIYEVNRSQTANRYLERVCYGNEKPYFPEDGGVAPLPAGLQWHFELLFDYGEYDVTPSNDTPYQPVRDWLARPDPFSSYKAGFERRTHRLCYHVLLFHRFTAELGPEPALVNALALAYDENPVASQLKSATTFGYRFHSKRPKGHRYTRKALPAVDLHYTPFGNDSGAFHRIADVDGNPLPGWGARGYQPVDLHGTGVPGVLFADGVTVEFWRPTLRERKTDGGTEPLSPIAYERTVLDAFPENRRTSGSEVTLADLNGDGRLDLVQLNPEAPGYYRSEPAGLWDAFRPLRSFPSDLNEPFDEYVDLTGNGRPDAVRVLQNEVQYYPSEGYGGYGALRSQPSTVSVAVAAPAAQRVYTGFADVLGAGMGQRVRISSGCVECWPILGYGRFGERVTLAGAPVFGAEISSARIHLADVDGSGAADLVLAFADHVDVYRNHGGNSFATDPISVDLPRPSALPEQITFADLTGLGYQALVFCSDNPSPAQWTYDFCGGKKPYLLDRLTNNRGGKTELTYKSSVHCFLEDRAAGLPWITTLPFPVQVLSDVVHRDGISETTVATSYRYHHGYYDPTEWEFRGFGMVEHFDVETVDAKSGSGARGGSTGFVAPQLSKTWYETGAWFVDTRLAKQYAREFFRGDPKAYAMPADVIDWNGGAPSGEGEQQARVALSGHRVREEIWGLEENAPFTVQQWNYKVRMEQGIGDHPYAVFFPHAREETTFQYQCTKDDPRVEHRFIFDVDGYGIVREACTVWYARRATRPDRADAQKKSWIACALHDVLDPQHGDDALLVGLTAADKRFELERLAGPTQVGLYYAFDALEKQVTTALQGKGGPNGPKATLVTWERHFYQGAGGGLAPPKNAELQALLVRSERAVFEDAFVRKLSKWPSLSGGVAAFLKEQAGYVFDSAAKMWWNPGLTASYFGASGFYEMQKVADAFALASSGRSGLTTSYVYDPHHLVLASVTTTPSAEDVLTQKVVANSIDYQALQVRSLTDVNGNTAEVHVDELCRVIATSHYGMEFRDGAPHATGFTPFDFDADAPWPTPTSADELVLNPGDYVRGAASYRYLDLDSMQQATPRPTHFITCAAEEYPAAQNPSVMVGRARIHATFDDGFGRAVQQSQLAEPGVAFLLDPQGAPSRNESGEITTGKIQRRWRVTGRVEYDQKGHPYREYQPFFSSSYVFVDDEEIAKFGVSDTHYYDELDRVVRTDTPKGDMLDAFFSATAYGPWSTTHSDEDDEVERSPFYERYITNHGAGLDKWEREALVKAAELADTPETDVLDPLGRVAVETRTTRVGTTLEAHPTERGFDLLGRVLWAADARLGPQGKKNVEFTYAMTGELLKTVNVDSGMRVQLFDVLGGSVYTEDGRGVVELTFYDSRHRACSTTVKGLGLDQVVERTIYGDSLVAGKTVFPNPTDRNMIDRPCVQYDQAQRVELSAYDLRGSLLAQSQQLRASYQNEADWSAPTPKTWSALFAALAPQLESHTHYTAEMRCNAVGQIVQTTDAEKNVMAFGFHVSGLLDTVSCEPSGGNAQPYVLGIRYDPRGDREELQYGAASGKALAVTRYAYDHATLRLSSIVTARSADGAKLQDLSYFYDPVGNITHVSNGVPGVVSHGKSVVGGDLDYTYDALYRLVGAEGRALAGYTADDQRTGTYAPFLQQAGPSALERYAITYAYDEGDNRRALTYSVGGQTKWVRKIVVDPDSNRGVDAALIAKGGTTPPFDANGNQLTMDGIAKIDWDYRNRAIEFTMAAAKDGGSAHQFATYDSAGSCVRRVSFGPGGGGESAETIYLATGLQLHRMFANGNKTEEYVRRPISDVDRVIAERLTWKTGAPPAGGSNTQSRFQLGNFLGSSVLELADDGTVLSTEEYSPYGGTVYASASDLAEIGLKQKRYSGKERSQTTGLYDYGLRHYAPWVGRWASPDPDGTVDGLNLYAFVRDNPVNRLDRHGTCGEKPRAQKPHPIAHTPLEVFKSSMKRGNQGQLSGGGPAASDDSSPAPRKPWRPSLVGINAVLISVNAGAEIAEGKLPKSSFILKQVLATRAGQAAIVGGAMGVYYYGTKAKAYWEEGHRLKAFSSGGLALMNGGFMVEGAMIHASLVNHAFHPRAALLGAAVDGGKSFFKFLSGDLLGGTAFALLARGNYNQAYKHLVPRSAPLLLAGLVVHQFGGAARSFLMGATETAKDALKMPPGGHWTEPHNIRRAAWGVPDRPREQKKLAEGKD